MVVNAPDAGVLTLKLETSDPNVFVEIPQNVETGWQELSFDVSSAPAGIVKASIFQIWERLVRHRLFIDDVTFPTATLVEPPADPMTSGPVAPVHDATDDGVVSLFGDARTDVTTAPGVLSTRAAVTTRLWIGW